MNKILTLAFAGLAATSVAATAADSKQSASTSDATTAFTAQLDADAKAEQVRNLLRAKKYTNVSELRRDANGRWSGTAIKDGKLQAVSVYLPEKRVSVTN